MADLRCSRCGAEIDTARAGSDGAATCPACGQTVRLAAPPLVPPPLPPRATPAERPKRNPLGLASLILALLSVFTGVIAIVGLPVGLVLGICGLVAARRKGLRRGEALAGVIICGIGLVVGSLAAVVWFSSGPMDEAAITRRRHEWLLAGIQAYEEVTGRVPPEAAGPGGADPNDSVRVLLEHLTGRKAEDPNEARRIAEATGPHLGPSPERLIEDGYGRPMRYYATRGIGGRPVIVSAGADGEFGDADDEKAMAAREDNIRSDVSD